MSEVNRPPWSGSGKSVVVKTPDEYIAEANGADGWECPRCGCKEWRVVNSYMQGDGRNRRRVCRHCGQGLLRTTEVPVPDGFTIKIVPK